MFNRNTWIILAVAAAFAGLLAGWHFTQRNDPPPGPALPAFPRFARPRHPPPSARARADRRALTNASLQGHWTLVFLGFTHCPDGCPTTLAQLKTAQTAWESIPADKRPRLLFVSVDPERDPPEIVGKYAQAFHSDTIAATGTQAALEQFARGLSLVFMKQPPDDLSQPNRYAVDHSAALAVLDPQGRMAGVIQPPLEPAKIAADFIALTEAAK